METLQETTTELKNKFEWNRTTFNFYEGKAWCYQKKVKHPDYDREILKGYYCYNPKCKNELVFKWRDKREYWEQEPFKFHKLLVKVLEKKEDDWKTDRKIHHYYAFCCKCAIKDKKDGTIKKEFGKIADAEIEKCDCAFFIKEKKREANEAISGSNLKMEETFELIRELKGIRDKIKPNYADVDNSFKGKMLIDFINRLINARSVEIENKADQENYLLLYNEWETKRNQQLEN